MMMNHQPVRRSRVEVSLVFLCFLLQVVVADADAQGQQQYGRGCDEMERKFAPDCCPIKDSSFISFCESLFDRSHYSSTGMIEMHEKWIGGYGIATSATATTNHDEGDNSNNAAANAGPDPPASAATQSSNSVGQGTHPNQQEEAENESDTTFSSEGTFPLPSSLLDELKQEEKEEEEASLTTTTATTVTEEEEEEEDQEKEGEDDDNETIIPPPVDVGNNNNNNNNNNPQGGDDDDDKKETPGGASEGTEGGCDAMEKAFAPDCCPIKDSSYSVFCDSLFERPHYNSTGMVEMHEKWIGGYGIAGTPPTSRSSSGSGGDGGG